MTKPIAVPGYVGKLQIADATNGDVDWGSAVALPLWAFGYGGSTECPAVYLASGFPYPDVFPERQDEMVMQLAGPLRSDFNPWTYSVPLIPGSLIQACVTAYPGQGDHDPFIGYDPSAIVQAFRWLTTARGQSGWMMSLVAAWNYSAFNSTCSLSPLFRGQGDDTNYDDVANL